MKCTLCHNEITNKKEATKNLHGQYVHKDCYKQLKTAIKKSFKYFAEV